MKKQNVSPCLSCIRIGKSKIHCSMTCQELAKFMKRLDLVQEKGGHAMTGADSINTTHSVSVDYATVYVF